MHLVLTGAEFPVPYGIMPVSQDEYPLAPERVRYVGDPVAAVIAVDEQTATEALELIDVKYQPLPTIASPEEGLAHPEPRIHDYGEQGNIHRNQSYEFGDVEEALAKSDHVFEDLFFYEGNTHLPMEQQASLAAVEGDGKLLLCSSTQNPHYLHRQLARVLQMPAAHIRVIATPNGGGFGGKCDPGNHEFVVSKAALMLGRPVKICLTREEVFYLHRGRHPVLMKFRTGVTKDGRLTGDAPADAARRRRLRLARAGEHVLHRRADAGHLRAAALQVRGLPRLHQQARLRSQARARHAAAALRPGSAARQDRRAPRPRSGRAAPEHGHQARLAHRELAARSARSGSPSASARWSRCPAGRSKHRKLPHGRGVGLACSTYMCGAGVSIYWNKMPHSGVQLLLDRSGQVTVFCGATEIGQGSDDVLAAIVAEVLGIDPGDMRCVTGDTGITPIDLGSYSSRVTIMMGNAAMQAAERVRELLATAAAEPLDTLPERVVFSQDRVFAAEDSAQER